jgi:hypothetical protein
MVALLLGLLSAPGHGYAEPLGTAITAVRGHAAATLGPGSVPPAFTTRLVVTRVAHYPSQLRLLSVVISSAQPLGGTGAYERAEVLCDACARGLGKLTHAVPNSTSLTIAIRERTILVPGSYLSVGFLRSESGQCIANPYVQCALFARWRNYRVQPLAARSRLLRLIDQSCVSPFALDARCP